MKGTSILVIGGGITGITSATEAAETGQQVLLIERKPYLGGRVAQLHKYFPKLCSPSCGLEINFRRIKNSPNIKVFTLAEVEKLAGGAGDLEATVRLHPRYIHLDKCTACNKCVEVCPAERSNDFNYGIDKTKAIYLPHEMAFPMRHVIDHSACLGESCAKCVEVCKYGAIDLSMQPTTIKLSANAAVLATGWSPYDAAKIDNLGFAKYRNVITNVMMERLAAINGPTGGKIVRPSDGKEVKAVAFVQCAGSRDENHLPYCSSICCLASLKQTTYIRETQPNARVYLFYMDLRTPGTYEGFLRQVQGDGGVSFIRGKVARVEKVPESEDLIVEAEDTLSGERIRIQVDMVVLATGMVPASNTSRIGDADMVFDTYGFASANQRSRICTAGVAKRPMDVTSSVRDGTGAALRAMSMQSISGG